MTACLLMQQDSQSLLEWLDDWQVSSSVLILQWSYVIASDVDDTSIQVKSSYLKLKALTCASVYLISQYRHC